MNVYIDIKNQTGAGTFTVQFPDKNDTWYKQGDRVYVTATTENVLFQYDYVTSAVEDITVSLDIYEQITDKLLKTVEIDLQTITGTTTFSTSTGSIDLGQGTTDNVLVSSAIPLTIVNPGDTITFNNLDDNSLSFSFDGGSSWYKNSINLANVDLTGSVGSMLIKREFNYLYDISEKNITFSTGGVSFSILVKSFFEVDEQLTAGLWKRGIGLNSIQSKLSTNTTTSAPYGISHGNDCVNDGRYTTMFGDGNADNGGGVHGNNFFNGFDNTINSSNAVFINGNDNIVNYLLGGLVVGSNNEVNSTFANPSYYNNISGSLNTVAESNNFITINGYNNNVDKGSGGATIFGRDNTVGTECEFNFISGDNNTIVGLATVASSDYNSILGKSHLVNINCNYSTISGESHTVEAGSINSSVIGGKTNNIDSDYSSILGGVTLSVSGTHASAIGGTNNIVSGAYATALGGFNNNILGSAGGILGAVNSDILGSAQNSAVLAGDNNSVSGSRSAIIGGQNLTLTDNDTVLVPKLKINTLNTWIALSHDSAFTDIGSPHPPLSYRILPGGRVQVRGAVTGGTGKQFCNMPASLYPSYRIRTTGQCIDASRSSADISKYVAIPIVVQEDNGSVYISNGLTYATDDQFYLDFTYSID